MTNLEPKTNHRPGSSTKGTPRGLSPASAPVSLVQAVREAVRAMPEAGLRPVARRDAGAAFQPRALLAVLTYCYARGIYGSEDVEDVLRRDAVFRQSCQEEFPDARLLRRFRRDNRATLHACLVSALAWLSERALGAGEASGGRECKLAEEAERRIMAAMFIDSMQLEGD